MTLKGTNMVHVKRQNRASILELIYSHGGLSRKGIAERIRLTPAAVTLITNNMIKEGLLKEIRVEPNSGKVGRKEVIIDINYSNYYAVGVNINLKMSRVICIDLKCRVKFEHCFQTPAFNTPESLISYACSTIMDNIQKHRIKKERIIGVGVGVRGIVDNNNGISLESYGLWDGEVNVKAMFEEQLLLPVEVDNNVRSIVRGQLFYSEDKPNSILLVKYGPGIGGALAIGDKLYTGYQYRAAELGHMIVDPLGAPCRCKQYGCLETIASYDAIQRDIRAVYSKSVTPVLYQLTGGDMAAFDIATIMKAYKNGDVVIRRIMSRVMGYFAIMIRNSITLYNPEKIILYGEAFDNADFFEELCNFTFKDTNNENAISLISKSEFNGDLDTKGPASLAIKNFFDNGGIAG